MAFEIRRKFRKVTAPQYHRRFGRRGEFARPLRPTRPEGLRNLRQGIDDLVTVRRRGITFNFDKRAELESRAVPITQVYGSVHERILYKELKKRNVPFNFQSSLLGGRQELGGMVADFILLGGYEPLIIQVMGTFWHDHIAAEVYDERQADVLEGMGYVVLFLWDYTIDDEYSLETWLENNVDISPAGPRMLIVNNQFSPN